MPQIQKISADFSLLAITFFKRLLKSVPIIPYYKGGKQNQSRSVYPSALLVRAGGILHSGVDWLVVNST